MAHDANGSADMRAQRNLPNAGAHARERKKVSLRND
jgi:hypothetical protein